MQKLLFSGYSGTLVALGALVAVACLACSWYINRLQAELARAVRQDAAGVEAAVNLQVQLRHLRVHTLVLVSSPTDERWAVVRGDLARVNAALKAIHATVGDEEDAQLADRIEKDFAAYREGLGLDRLPDSTGPMSAVARWSDAHHMSALLAPCQTLADRQNDRMNGNLLRSETQTAWAGRVLIGLGLGGILAGLLSGYVTARTLTRQVAQLSVRVQAVQAQLDQEAGALTVHGPTHFGDLDEQLDHIIARVSAVCQRLQEQERNLLRAEQLAAVGQLAAGVAHEVRNPLTGVKLLLQAAVRAQNPTPLTESRLRLLLQEVARIERTVQGLVDFAAMRPPDRRPHELGEIVEAAIDIAQSRAETKSVTIRLAPTADAANVFVDRDQMLSVLTNLLFNAIDASEAGSEVEITFAPVESDKIQVEVADRGVGIEPEIADALFTPFSTTKRTGTGLGLTVARKIAQEHGGSLTASNRPDGGARFLLTLPAERH